MSGKYRPLTNGMKEVLLEIYKREMANTGLCDQQTRHIKGLFERKLIDVRNVVDEHGKPYVGFCTTGAGRDYIKSMIDEIKNLAGQ